MTWISGVYVTDCRFLYDLPVGTNASLRFFMVCL